MMSNVRGDTWAQKNNAWLRLTKVADPAAVDTLDKRDVSPGGYAKCPKWLLFLRRMRNPHGIFRSKEGNCRCIFGFAGLQNRKNERPKL